MYILLNNIFMIINLIMILISVAFLTMLERKLLGYIQYRKGPNKVGLMGILQPFSDAIKLFSKEMYFLKKSNQIIYMLSPLYGLFLSLLTWLMLTPNHNNLFQLNYSILILISCLMVSIYSTMFSGWASNSNYPMIGSLRSISQSISYEISFSLIMLMLLMLIESFSIMDFFMFQSKIMFVFFNLPIFIMFYLSIIAELNRSPFDLMEGESELVSGFNTEYMGSLFAMIFLAEYSFIIFYNYMTIIFFFGIKNLILFMILILMLNLIIISIRGICPRIRYDQLMYFCWLTILPMTLQFLLINSFLKFWFLMYYSLNSLY